MVYSVFTGFIGCIKDNNDYSFLLGVLQEGGFICCIKDNNDCSFLLGVLQEGACHFNDTLRGARLDRFAYVPPKNATALKIAVARFGPAAVTINESPLTMKFYSDGIYDDPKCGKLVVPVF